MVKDKSKFQTGEVQDSEAKEAEMQASGSDGAKEKFIDVATKLFAENGFDGTSTRDIAKNADLNISLISYYFGGKEGLYKAVIHDFVLKALDASNSLLQTLDVDKLNKESFLDFMRKFLSRMLPMKYSTREVQRLLHREILQGLPHTHEIFDNLFASIMVRFVGIYERGQKKGFIREDVNPYLLFFSMVHSVDQYILMSDSCKTKIQDHLPKLPEEMAEYADQIFKIFVEGVLR